MNKGMEKSVNIVCALLLLLLLVVVVLQIPSVVRNVCHRRKKRGLSGVKIEITDTQIYRQTATQTDGQTDRQTHTHTHTPTHTHTHTHTHSHS